MCDSSRAIFRFLCRQERQPHGSHFINFSLLELLIVVAIISILMALLMPALNRALDGSRSTACTNHLKLFSSVFAAYADDNHGFLMIATPKAVYPIWNQQLIAGNTNKKDYIRDINIFYCPAMKNRPHPPAQFEQQVNGSMPCEQVHYGINEDLFAGSVFKPYSSKNPAKKILLLDSYQNLGTGYDPDNGRWRIMFSGGDFYNLYNAPRGRAAPRHQSSCNFLCADGHTESAFACSDNPTLTDPFNWNILANRQRLSWQY